MAAAGYTFDVAYTSVLKRAIHTLWLALEEADTMYLPVIKHWRLNERHYGALQVGTAAVCGVPGGGACTHVCKGVRHGRRTQEAMRHGGGRMHTTHPHCTTPMSARGGTAHAVICRDCLLTRTPRLATWPHAHR